VYFGDNRRMSGDISQLQRLTDEQVQSRLRAYADGGRFQEALRWLWDQAGDIIEETSAKHFGDAVAKLNREHFTKPVNLQKLAEVLAELNGM